MKSRKRKGQIAIEMLMALLIVIGMIAAFAYPQLKGSDKAVLVPVIKDTTLEALDYLKSPVIITNSPYDKLNDLKKNGTIEVQLLDYTVTTNDNTVTIYITLKNNSPASNDEIEKAVKSFIIAKTTRLNGVVEENGKVKYKKTSYNILIVILP